MCFSPNQDTPLWSWNSRSTEKVTNTVTVCKKEPTMFILCKGNGQENKVVVGNKKIREDIVKGNLVWEQGNDHILQYFQ